MAIVDDLAADLDADRWARWEQAHELAHFGITDPARLRAILAEEARLYPEEVLDTCAGCGATTHIALLIACPECGALVCADCSPTCPHTEG